MWCGKQILRMKEDEIIDLKRKIDSLERDFKWAKDELTSTQDAYTSLARQAPIIIDWDNIDVFSVERIHRKDGKECMPYTVIGYWKNVVENGMVIRRVGEWHYHTDEINHMKIAQEFKDRLDKKAKRK